MWLSNWFYKSAATLIVASGFGAFSSGIAAPITYNFSGTVFHSNTLVAGDAPVGSTLTGSYTVETTTADSNPGDSSLGEYVNAVVSFSYTVGGVSGGFSSNLAVTVGNDLDGQAFSGSYDG